MPPDLRRELEKAATLSRRSLNAEIVARLEKSLESDGLTKPKEERKTYTVYPGRIADQVNEYTARGVNLKALQIVIEKGETYIKALGKPVGPEKRAKLYDAMYAICEGDDRCDIPDETIEKLISLAS